MRIIQQGYSHVDCNTEKSRVHPHSLGFFFIIIIWHRSTVEVDLKKYEISPRYVDSFSSQVKLQNSVKTENGIFSFTLEEVFVIQLYGSGMGAVLHSFTTRTYRGRRDVGGGLKNGLGILYKTVSPRDNRRRRPLGGGVFRKIQLGAKEKGAHKIQTTFNNRQRGQRFRALLHTIHVSNVIKSKKIATVSKCTHVT